MMKQDAVQPFPLQKVLMGLFVVSVLIFFVFAWRMGSSLSAEKESHKADLSALNQSVSQQARLAAAAFSGRHSGDVIVFNGANSPIAQSGYAFNYVRAGQPMCDTLLPLPAVFGNDATPLSPASLRVPAADIWQTYVLVPTKANSTEDTSRVFCGVNMKEHSWVTLEYAQLLSQNQPLP